MRIDLRETGYKDIDIEFNGKPLDAALWADDQTGECEILEMDYRTNQPIIDMDNPCGYRTMIVKGNVKITDRRPKPVDQGLLDFQYPDVCCLYVDPARYAADASTITVFDWYSSKIIQTFFLHGLTCNELASAVIGLKQRLNVQLVRCDKTGVGAGVYTILNQFLNCPLYPC